MSLRATKYVFALERAPNGEPVVKIGLQLMALIAGYHLNETNTARVPLDHLQKFLHCTPVIAENYIEQLVRCGLVEVVEVEPEGYVRLKICGLAEDAPIPAVPDLIEHHTEQPPELPFTQEQSNP